MHLLNFDTHIQFSDQYYEAPLKINLKIVNCSRHIKINLGI